MSAGHGVPALAAYPSGVLTAKQLKRLNLTVTGEPDAVVWELGVPVPDIGDAMEGAIGAATAYLDDLEAMDNPYQNSSIEEDRKILVWFALWLYNRNQVTAPLAFSPELELADRAQEWASLMTWFLDARDDARAWLTGT